MVRSGFCIRTVLGTAAAWIVGPLRGEFNLRSISVRAQKCKTMSNPGACSGTCILLVGVVMLAPSSSGRRTITCGLGTSGMPLNDNVPSWAMASPGPGAIVVCCQGTTRNDLVQKMSLAPWSCSSLFWPYWEPPSPLPPPLRLGFLGYKTFRQGGCSGGGHELGYSGRWRLEGPHKADDDASESLHEPCAGRGYLHTGP